MAYVCEIHPGHHVYLDNQAGQTNVTTVLSMPGQQQQASSSMTTGPWTAPPAAYQTPGGTVFKLFTAQNEICIYIQANSVKMTNSAPSVAGAQSLPVKQAAAMPSMAASLEPMPPMTMGNMQMTMNPMEMRMGNMELKMEVPQQQTSSVSQSSPAVRQFCSQCGNKVAPDDRFCSSCGHALQS